MNGDARNRDQGAELSQVGVTPVQVFRFRAIRVTPGMKLDPRYGRPGRGAKTRHELMRQLATVREELQAFGIRDAADYAEALVAEALVGERSKSRVNKGHDVLTKHYGRVEVKCRQLPPDGRLEERVTVGSGKEDGFEFLAIVIFRPDFSVKGAVAVPYAAVWDFVARQQYNRVGYAQACQLPGAVDITAAVKAVSEH